MEAVDLWWWTVVHAVAGRRRQARAGFVWAVKVLRDSSIDRYLAADDAAADSGAYWDTDGERELDRVEGVVGMASPIAAGASFCIVMKMLALGCVHRRALATDRARVAAKRPTVNAVVAAVDEGRIGVLLVLVFVELVDNLFRQSVNDGEPPAARPDIDVFPQPRAGRVKNVRTRLGGGGKCLGDSLVGGRGRVERRDDMGLGRGRRLVGRGRKVERGSDEGSNERENFDGDVVEAWKVLLWFIVGIFLDGLGDGGCPGH